MLDSPGTLLMNIDGPTAHAIQASGEDDGFFVQIPTGLVSPNVSYEYGAYHMKSDGNVDLSNWSIDYSYGLSEHY